MDGLLRNQLWEKAKKMKLRDQEILTKEIEIRNCTFKPKILKKKKMKRNKNEKKFNSNFRRKSQRVS